jgi:hypothetical protein
MAAPPPAGAGEETDPAAAALASPEPVAAADGLAGRLLGLLEGLSAELSGLQGLVSLLRSLERASGDFRKLEEGLSKARQRLGELGPLAPRAEELFQELDGALARERQEQRERLSKELRAACEARGLTLRVVSREEPVEVRIPPFAVSIDRERGLAELRFARLPLLSCPAKAEEILATHQRCLAELEAGLEPREFFLACQRAWAAARAAAGPQTSERVEFNQFLPYLAVQMQSKAFAIDPLADHYRTYSRVRFAYDILRLQRAGLMSLGGWRLNLGVATGTTASTKNRALFIENPHGEGEFKLTLFFTPQPETP